MRSHSTKPKKSHADEIHDEAIEFLNDIGGFIAPLLPNGWKYSLFLNAGEGELFYWGGTMTTEEAGKFIQIVLEKSHADKAKALNK